MDVEKLLEPAADWSGVTWLGRIDQSASLLYCHGYISLSQRAKITRKLEKQIASLPQDSAR